MVVAERCAMVFVLQADVDDAVQRDAVPGQTLVFRFRCGGALCLCDTRYGRHQGCRDGGSKQVGGAMG